ncbi:glycoside hydrolase family 61 protein [Colletotrichum chrysophilum]|uniref:lytic cellulose monooxygenase (C4-dehydrogenating) n=1 Tax=Colletotrichum chrysophilum TaxID=1836956 RepID=A0AAD9A3D9_9PEZI|nr:glycoside hydrolase family 61 protein [Colletotrichum chrysophilum]
MRVEIVVPLLWLTPTVSCHGAVTNYTVDGKVYPGRRCNGGNSADPTGTLKPGTNITANWKQWTHAQGLVMVWLGDKQTWFKIDQMGLWDSNLNSENWGTAIVLKQLKWSNKIPSNLKPRKYLPLYELLALCQANTPQFYFDCAQVVMEGSGTANATFVYFQIGIYQGGHPSEDPPGGAVWSGCE